MQVEVRSFGELQGESFDEIIVEQRGEFQFRFTNLGARLNAWEIPNEQGEFESITLGFDNAAHAKEGEGYYYGATVGRVAGRLANGQVTIDGQDYQFAQNDGDNHLHGGLETMDLKRWDYEIEEHESSVSVIFTYRDVDGANGYPGNLEVKVIHTVTANNEWQIAYQAATDQTTLFNPTNHVYFNLNGHASDTIENHKLTVKASNYLPIDDANLPTGEIASVEGTTFDLRDGRVFGDLLNEQDAQFAIHQGFDHPFILDDAADYHGVIEVADKARQLYFKTDEPAVVIYTQNYVPDETTIWGEELKRYSGFTLETQKEPDALRHDNFSSIVLEKGQTFKSQTTYWLKTK